MKYLSILSIAYFITTNNLNALISSPLEETSWGGDRNNKKQEFFQEVQILLSTDRRKCIYC